MQRAAVLHGLDALQIFARVQVGDRDVVFCNLVADGPLAFVPKHFANDAGPRFVAHSAAEDFDPIADVESFVSDFLPKGGPRAERDVAVVQAMKLAVDAVAAEIRGRWESSCGRARHRPDGASRCRLAASGGSSRISGRF